MHTTYHLKSAQELNSDIIDAIKTAFKSKPITIIIEENESDVELNSDIKLILDERLEENDSTYLTSEESIKHLNEKYGL